MSQKPKQEQKSNPLGGRCHDGLDHADPRINRVVVMLSNAELAELDSAIVGKYKRPEYIRAVLFGRPLPAPVIIPEVNLELSRVLGKSFGNLSTIAVAMRKGEFIAFDEIAPLVMQIQNQLKGVRIYE